MANKQAKSTVTLLDLLCEGEIKGPAVNSSWDQSTYYNDTQLYNSS
jgi:hypothetical protein